ncbi:hypothetical protein [Spiroplasma culicicola]|uniref:Uncharacterized protein n=1 Tax=Spiroplasma culicicola AES-1 TaxID=1276246 RepID=W6A7H5_9MOLU|nr:hypothetical protein [Spiroplasma culicicola]AHI53093.1 hypothetical protein SCULI_v1c07520 [Spiroplasma culicicola AES-1]
MRIEIDTFFIPGVINEITDFKNKLIAELESKNIELDIDFEDLDNLLYDLESGFDEIVDNIDEHNEDLDVD